MVLRAGLIIGIITLLFFMGLIIASIFGMTVPNDSQFLINIVLSLGAALSIAFIGGHASANGNLSIPILGSNPLQVSATGGFAVLVIVLIITQLLYPRLPNEQGLQSTTTPMPSATTISILTPPVVAPSLTSVMPSPTVTPSPTDVPDEITAINGVWIGTFVSEGGFSYEYRLEIAQSGSEITGTAQATQLSNPQLLVITRVRGSFGDDILHFEEYEIIQDSTGVSCFISATLTYNNFSQYETLSGRWQGRPNINMCPGNGTLDLQKYE
jgi:hypothetical protein